MLGDLGLRPVLQVQVCDLLTAVEDADLKQGKLCGGQRSPLNRGASSADTKKAGMVRDDRAGHRALHGSGELTLAGAVFLRSRRWLGFQTPHDPCPRPSSTSARLLANLSILQA